MLLFGMFCVCVRACVCMSVCVGVFGMDDVWFVVALFELGVWCVRVSVRVWFGSACVVVLCWSSVMRVRLLCV